MPRREKSEGQPVRPAPRRGAGRGGGRKRDRGAGGGVAGSLNPFNVAGRQRRGRSLREQEEEPYSYDSNDRQLIIIRVVLALWIGLAIATAVADFQERRVLSRWAEHGFVSVPPGDSAQSVLDHAAVVGVPCTPEPVTGVIPFRCEQLFDFAREMDEAQTLVFGLFAGYLFLFIALAVLVSSFAYQANRNLLTLKAEGQHFSAVSAMLWLYVPVINFYKGHQIFQEIWKGSDPEQPEEAGEGWKQSAGSPLVFGWWAAFAVIVMIGPRTIRWIWGSSIVEERLDLAWGLILTDLFLVVPAIFALLAMNRIHERQEKRRELVGEHMAVPPIRGISL